ncbi:MAG: MFS transporter [Proteobacteria bacterium]|nr:MFS transporter [Pseudomonadota bacterium]
MTAEARSAKLSLGFASVGHTYSHLFQPLYFVAALSLEKQLGITHGEAISLAVLGAGLFGFAAPVAGWLGDRFGAIPLMSLFYLGTGSAMILTGFADVPWQIMAGLGLTGLFASIYHPVGIAWLIRNAINRGTALGINGIFGGIGPAIAALSAGAIIEFFSWRAVFLIPGTIILLTGAAFIFLVGRGLIVENKADRVPQPPADAGGAGRVFSVLAFTMLCTGIIYQATQAGLPKMFSIRLADTFQGGIFGISTVVAAVLFVSSFMQLAGGWLADRVPPKTVYITAFILQVPLLIAAASVSGPLMIFVAIMMISANNAGLPSENVILVKYIPPTRRSLAFGLKFVMAIGFSAIGVKLEGVLFDATGDFYRLFTVLAAVAAAAGVAALLLPSDRPSAQPAAQPAE